MSWQQLDYHKEATKQKNSFAGNEVWLLLPISLLIITPIIVLYFLPNIGTYVNASVIALLVAIGLVSSRMQKIAFAGVILPVSFMIALSMPNTSDFITTMSLYAAILVFSLVYRLFMQDSLAEKNNHFSLREFTIVAPQAIIVGQLLGGLAFVFLSPNLPFFAVPTQVVAIAFTALAFVEIIFFQGLLQSFAEETIPRPLAAAFVVALYAGISAIASVELLLVNTFAGICFAVFFYFKQTILPAIIANIMMKLVFFGLVTFA